MLKSQSVTENGPVSLELNLDDLDLNAVAAMKGSALEGIIQELNEEGGEPSHARHSSHSSYSTHGTAAW